MIKRLHEWRVYQMTPTQYCITSQMRRHTSYNLARNKYVLSCDLKLPMGAAVFNHIGMPFQSSGAAAAKYLLPYAVDVLTLDRRHCEDDLSTRDGW